MRGGRVADLAPCLAQRAEQMTALVVASGAVHVPLTMAVGRKAVWGDFDKIRLQKQQQQNDKAEEIVQIHTNNDANILLVVVLLVVVLALSFNGGETHRRSRGGNLYILVSETTA